MEATDLNLPTLIALAGAETERMQLDRLAAAGYEGVRRSHGYLFQHLVEGTPTITELATALGITQQGASKQVRELAATGYVERREVAGDARARTVALTARGRRSIEAARDAQAELEKELVARVGAERVAAAKETMVALLDIAGVTDRARTRSFLSPAD
jgi:DNA-binding MarR family transcriptional regulator